jgi:hypothetical protein
MKRLRRDQRRKRTIIQGACTSSTLRGGPLPQRDFFVYRVEKSINEDDIKDHLSSRHVENAEVELLSHDHSKFGSFKVKICVTDVPKIMDPNMWPPGIRVRKYFPKRDHNG